MIGLLNKASIAKSKEFPNEVLQKLAYRTNRYPKSY